MVMIRTTFDLAKDKLENHIGVIKMPLQQTTKKYVVMSLSSSPNKNRMIDVNTLTKKLIEGAQSALKARETGDYLTFAGDLMKNIELMSNLDGAKRNASDISDTDVYLLGFQMVNEQLDILQSEADLLLDRTNQLLSGLLNQNQKFLNQKILPYKSMDKMVKEINRKEYPLKVNIKPSDGFKDTIEITRFMSNEGLKINYWFKLIAGNQMLQKIPWSSTMNYVISKLGLNNQEKEVVDTAKKLVPKLIKFQEGGLNTKGAEISQFILIGCEGFGCLIGIAYVLIRRYCPANNNNQIQNINNNLPLQQVQNAEEEDEDIDGFGNPV